MHLICAVLLAVLVAQPGTPLLSPFHQPCEANAFVTTNTSSRLHPARAQHLMHLHIVAKKLRSAMQGCTPARQGSHSRRRHSPWSC